MKVDKLVLPKKEVTPVAPSGAEGANGGGGPAKVEVKPEPVVKPEHKGLSPRQIEAKEKAEKEAKENPVKAPDAPEYIPNEAEGFVTMTAADPKMILEVSIGDQFWKGHSITVPKQFEGDVRRLLEVAGMYVKN